MGSGFVIVVGGATLLFATPRLMMLKPSVAHFAVAAIMVRRGWMRRYLPPIVQQRMSRRSSMPPAMPGRRWREAHPLQRLDRPP